MSSDQAVTMKLLCALLLCALLLCALPTLSRAAHSSDNSSSVRLLGLCSYLSHNQPVLIGAFVPQCDANGNFLPQQCDGSTGFCWCVDVFTGQEIPNTRTSPGTRPVDCGGYSPYCPYGWTQYGKQCFIFIDSPKTWLEALHYCWFDGANLASVHSEEESRFIQDLTRGSTHDFPHSWLGGHDAVYGCVWMWSDGSYFDYSNWDSDCKKSVTEHCLKINYGYHWKWIPCTCNETLPFVCAKSI